VWQGVFTAMLIIFRGVLLPNDSMASQDVAAPQFSGIGGLDDGMKDMEHSGAL
jgi:hypothetical protein